MGRPKKSNKLNETEITIDSSKEYAITSAFSAFLSSNDIESSLTDDIVKIPSGIDLLDAITDGGIPCKFSMYIGKPGSGKSTLLASFIKNGQKLWGDKFITIYADSEESMSQKRLKELGCTHPVHIVNGLTIEKLFKCVESICSFKSSQSDLIDIPSLIIWDSIANTQTEQLLASEELSNTDGARRANVLSRLIPKYIDKLVKYNIALVAVNQFRQKLNMNGMPAAADMRFMKQDQTLPGGQTVNFNAYQLFEVEQGPAYPNDPYGYTMSPVKVRAIKNKAFSPNIPIVINFNPSRGFSNFWTNYEFLKSRKYIDVGATCKLKSYPTKTFRQKQASNLYNENKEWREAFDSDLKSALQEFIEENSGGDIDGIYWDPDVKTEEKEPFVWNPNNKSKDKEKEILLEDISAQIEEEQEDSSKFIEDEE